MAISRREVLKSLLGIPVLGALFYFITTKWRSDQLKKADIIGELALEKQSPAVQPEGLSTKKDDVVRLGIVGFGNRGKDLSRVLGFSTPDWIAKARRIEQKNVRDPRYSNWLAQEDINVQVAGISDVFDLRAEEGLTAARSDLKVKPWPDPVRFRHYQVQLYIAVYQGHRLPLLLLVSRSLISKAPTGPFIWKPDSKKLFFRLARSFGWAERAWH